MGGKEMTEFAPLMGELQQWHCGGRPDLGSRTISLQHRWVGDARKEVTGQEVTGGVWGKEAQRQPRLGGWDFQERAQPRRPKGTFLCFCFGDVPNYMAIFKFINIK